MYKNLPRIDIVVIKLSKKKLLSSLTYFVIAKLLSSVLFEMNTLNDEYKYSTYKYIHMRAYVYLKQNRRRDKSCLCFICICVYIYVCSKFCSLYILFIQLYVSNIYIYMQKEKSIKT